jgi:predicted RNA-binding protein associated with RNAse of E/G family
MTELELVRRPVMDVVECWPPMPVGTRLECVKVDPDGEIVTRYPAVVIEADAPEPWIAVQATWVTKVVDLNGLLFIPGDTMHEFFSPEHPFNLFSIFSPEGTLRGWYANVTYPTVVDDHDGARSLYWHDLYLDVVALPDGSIFVRDEDELDEAGLATSNPQLCAQIVDTKDELVRRAEAREFPFHES